MQTQHRYLSVGSDRWFYGRVFLGEVKGNVCHEPAEWLAVELGAYCQLRRQVAGVQLPIVRPALV